MERMINTKCHGCAKSMELKAEPVNLVDLTEKGVVIKTHWGKDTAVWICAECRTHPEKLRAARKATGWLPEEPNVSHYDA